MSTPTPDDHPSARTIRLEVEVPGTPEEVWDAIATGPGISAWFVPAEVNPEIGGDVRIEFAPDIHETMKVTAFDPPRRFAYGGPEGDRSLAYEWLVEAASGGTCVVRLVNSGFGPGADWDDDFEGMHSGWRLFLDNLRLYRTHFPGQRCASIIVNGVAPGDQAEAWKAVTSSLGLPPVATEGERLQTSVAGAPRIAGRVERVADGILTFLLDDPATGIAFVAAEKYGGQTHASFYAYLFGPAAADAAAREEPRWRAWMEENFPSPAPG